MKSEDESKKDDVRLLITNLEENLETDDIQEADLDGEAEMDVADDVPVAVMEEMEQEGAADSANTRSVWKMFSSEDLPQLSLREILGGDYLLGSMLRRNIWFILLLVLLGILYISNRYAAQQDIIEEEELRRTLVEQKNYALTQYAELTMQSRQSNIERKLKTFGDSLLRSPKDPPFIIRVKKTQ